MARDKYQMGSIHCHETFGLLLDVPIPLGWPRGQGLLRRLGSTFPHGSKAKFAGGKELEFRSTYLVHPFIRIDHLVTFFNNYCLGSKLKALI